MGSRRYGARRPNRYFPTRSIHPPWYRRLVPSPREYCDGARVHRWVLRRLYDWYYLGTAIGSEMVVRVVLTRSCVVLLQTTHKSSRVSMPRLCVSPSTQASCAICLPLRCAMSGADIALGAICLGSQYAMPGTHIANHASRIGTCGVRH